MRRSHQSDTRRWIEEQFQKCECSQFIQDPYDANKCGCGRDKGQHDPMPDWPTGRWTYQKNTVSYPTDTYGQVEFGTGVKAQYVRLTPGGKFADIIHLLTNIWGVEPPKLILSVHGGMSNFELPNRIKRPFRKSLQRMAAVPGVWIVTTGLNVGVVKHIGDALTAGVLRRHRAVVIGIAPWGVVANRNRLVARDGDIRYFPPATAPASTVLNPNHTFFLLIDDGTAGKYGAEAKWRRNFEAEISSPSLGLNVPLVALMVEGGANCIRVAVDYLADSKPVVVVEGSGRAADVLSLACKQLDKGDELGLSTAGVLSEAEVTLLNAVQNAFGISTNKNRMSLNEVILCTKRRELITIWHPLENDTKSTLDSNDQLDLCVLAALLRAQRRTAPEKLRLALAWNRVDLAVKQIFFDDQVWPDGALNDAMFEALVMDRVDFVQLLLDHGVNVAEVLTSERLETLYNIKHPDTWMIRKVAKYILNRSPSARLSMTDIADIVDTLMGFGYRSSYRHPKYSTKPAQQQTEGFELLSKTQTQANLQLTKMEEAERFQRPFSDLLIWAVLMKRQRMAKLMWRLGEEALAKGLIACRLYRSMASYLTGDVTSETLKLQLKDSAQEFADMAYDLIDRCHKLDELTAQQLLTYELHNFGNKTCLSLAVNAEHKQLVAHPCSQNLLSVLWMGGLKTRSSTAWKVILGILFPPFALWGLEYLTQEELRLQPQTEQELEDQRLLELSQDSDDILPGIAYYEEGVTLGTSSRFGRFPDSVRHRPKTSLENAESASPEEPLVKFEPKEQHTQAQSPIPGRSRYSLIADIEMESGKPLPLKTRFDEFYNAPVTKFWLHTMGYLVFIACFAYTILTRSDEYSAQWPEIYITAYALTLSLDKVREFYTIDAIGIGSRLEIYLHDIWNIFDAVAIMLFAIGIPLRWVPATFEFGRAFFIVSMIFFLIHVFDILQANQDLATYITILHNMLKRMISFLVILGIVVACYGVIMQASRFPFRTPEWDILKDIFVEPYFNLYGEVYHEYIDTRMCDSKSKTSTDPYSPPCWCCGWLGPVAQTVYLIVANILMLNLLIAVFNNVFEKVNKISKILTKYQRYRMIVDYQLLPALPPPFIIICHIYAVSKTLIRKCRGRHTAARDPGLLKLVLTEEDENQLHDFEEQARDEVIEQKEQLVKLSNDEQLRATADRSEAMQMAIEQIIQRQAQTLEILKDLESRVNSMTLSVPALTPTGRPNLMMSMTTNMQRLIAQDDAAATGSRQSVLFQAGGDSPPIRPMNLLASNETIPSGNGSAASLQPSSQPILQLSPRDVKSMVKQSSVDTPTTPRSAPSLARTNSAEVAPSSVAEESSTRAIGPDVYRRLREVSVSADDSEYSRAVRTLIENPEQIGASDVEEENDDDLIEEVDEEEKSSSSEGNNDGNADTWDVPPTSPPTPQEQRKDNNQTD